MNLRMSAGPHFVARESTQTLMLDVLIALIPTTAAGVYLFGLRAAWVLAVSVISAVLAEFVWQKLARKPVRVNDLSAAVTGLILGLNMPAEVPLWLPAIGSIIAILLVKQLFGGIGQNFMNPAMLARGIMLVSWPAQMTVYTLPMRVLGSTSVVPSPDAVSAATALIRPSAYNPYDLLVGNIPGTVGEVCKLAIIIGFLYMLFVGTISWHIPVTFVGSVALLSWILGSDPWMAILSGGVLFGAVFMATDYVTNPLLKVGHIIFGIGCGIIVVVIRKFGGYPEGVTFAILLMNTVTPLIDRWTKRRVYGTVKKHG
ncbi:MAG: RnfABCDGE type electron transport complex subunit D [Eubacteriales bacterium]|jgi:electron transport complex protein RnfD|nr:RnfABCDGE type electron transport complex subunit D [Eubacteriales bacterium]MDD4134666.1 RnfABCDGE type electron transport complex subunit D [Eubacteriales bacterium]NLO13478.1 RnfABCDGE type electron transport complex subunit D [Clostridiales bacterium]